MHLYIGKQLCSVHSPTGGREACRGFSHFGFMMFSLIRQEGTGGVAVTTTWLTVLTSANRGNRWKGTRGFASGEAWVLPSVGRASGGRTPWHMLPRRQQEGRRRIDKHMEKWLNGDEVIPLRNSNLQKIERNKKNEMNLVFKCNFPAATLFVSFCFHQEQKQASWHFKY